MSKYGNIVIPTYVVRTLELQESESNIRQQFGQHMEFGVRVVERTITEKDKDGLWATFCKAVHEVAAKGEDDLFVFCRDDIRFTSSYDRDTFIENIIEAGSKETHILCGDAADFGCAVPIGRQLSWIDWIKDSRLMVVFRSAYGKILELSERDEPLENVLSKAIPNKLLIYPFIAEKQQREPSEQDIVATVPHLKPSARVRMEKLWGMYKFFREKNAKKIND